jgi:sulfate permease, SulP family
MSVDSPASSQAPATASTAARAGRADGLSLHDVWGGLAAMLVAFPAAIAYGVVVFTAASPSLAAAGALAGIAGAVILGIVAPLVGRNPGFITAPCAPAAAILGGLAAQLAGAQRLPAAHVVALLGLTALLSSLLQITYGALGAGRVMKYIPYQVVTGYLSGVAVIIAAAQLPKFLAVPAGTSVGEALVSPWLWRWPGIIIGSVTIAAMALAQKLTRRVPAAIIGLTAGVSAYFLIALARPELLRLEGNSLVIGSIGASGSIVDAALMRSRSLLTFQMSDFALVMSAALALSVLLSIDTLKTGVVLDVLMRRRHDSNRELVAQGTANLAAFFGGGMAGAGTMGPSLMNVTSGGRSIWSGVIAGALILVTFVLFAPYMAWLPISALAGILLVIAWRLFDFSVFRLLRQRATRLDFVVIAAVVIVAATIGLIEASLVGVFLAILIFIRNQIRSSVILRKSDVSASRSKQQRSRAANTILAQHGSEAAVVQLQGDLFFGTTDQLFSELERDLDEKRFVLLDLRRVQSVDFTAVRLFDQMHERLRERDGGLLFSGMPSRARREIEKYLSDVGTLAGEESIRVFETRDGALEWMEERILEAHGWQVRDAAPPIDLEQFPLFAPLGPEAMEAVRAAAEERRAEGGTNVFSSGEAGDEIFFVRRGRVQVLLPLPGGKRHHLATFCRGEFFGEMAFLDRGKRSADAEAVVSTEMYVISRQRFDEIIARDHAAGAKLFEELARAIAQRLRAADAELSALEDR